MIGRARSSIGGKAGHDRRIFLAGGHSSFEVRPDGAGSSADRYCHDPDAPSGSSARLIMALTVVGAIGGVLLAMSTPSVYVSESKLYVDPREVRLTDSDLSKESLATEAILALVDSQLEVLRSRRFWKRSPLTWGSTAIRNSAAIPRARAAWQPGSMSSARSFPPARESRRRHPGVNPRTLEKLSEAVTVSRDPKTFIVTDRGQTPRSGQIGADRQPSCLDISRRRAGGPIRFLPADHGGARQPAG